MTNGKSGRKKKINPLLAIITIFILVIGSYFGIDFTDYADQEVEGQLVVHMIDVGQADCFLLIQDGKTALVDCGTRSTGKDAVEYIKE